MKLSRFLIATVACIALATPLFAYAQDLTSGLKSAAGIAGLSGGSGDASSVVIAVIGGVINKVLGFLGVAFLVLMLYAGFRWMTAA